MKFYSLSQLSGVEKSTILDKHKKIYDGYRKVWEPVSSEQPLYIQDFANDKNGMTVNNKGNVMAYTNMNINESNEVEEGLYDEKDIDPNAEFDFIEKEEKDIDLDDFTPAYRDVDEEISGPLYSEVKPAYDFVSDGPLREDDLEEMYYDTHDWDKMDFYSQNFMPNSDKSPSEETFDDVEPEELPLKDRLKKGKRDVEDIPWEDLDDDIKESFILQQNKINEMFHRMSHFN